MNKIDLSNNICTMLVHSRQDAGKSQKYMALALGKTLNTIQNYENGSSHISINLLFEWFDALGLNMLHYLLCDMYPHIYSDKLIKDDADGARNALIDYINNVANDDDLLKLAFVICMRTGSSWRAQLDMLTAINHLTLKSRVNVAQTVLNDYLMENSQNNLILTDYIQPDIKTLSAAIENGKNAVYSNKKGYYNENIKTGD